MSKIYTFDTSGGKSTTDIIVFHSFLEAFENLYRSICHKYSRTIPLFGDNYFIKKIKEIFIQDDSNIYFSSTCINLAQDLYGQPPEYLKKINDDMKEIFFQLREIFNKGVNKENIYFEFENIVLSSVDDDIDEITMSGYPKEEFNPMDPDQIAMMEKELLEDDDDEIALYETITPNKELPGKVKTELQPVEAQYYELKSIDKNDYFDAGLYVDMSNDKSYYGNPELEPLYNVPQSTKKYAWK